MTLSENGNRGNITSARKSRVTWMCKNSLALATLFSLLFDECASINKLTPVGVPLSRTALYDPQKDFSCLDGSKLIPFSFINDDYCDCADGSDEPGTSACDQGSFYCLNANHIAAFIPSSRVNDNICDCCDGSDEFDGNTNCTNTCDELGRAAREEQERQVRQIREGYQKRLEMSREGKEIRRNKELERSQLQLELSQAQAIKDEKTKIKEAAEGPEKEALEKHRQKEEDQRRADEEKEKKEMAEEAERIFKLLDSNEDNVLTVDEIKTRQTFDRNKDGAVSDEEAMFFLNMENEMKKEEFLKSGWIIVKPYFLMESGMFTTPDTEPEKANSEKDSGSDTNYPQDLPDTDSENLEDDELDELNESGRERIDDGMDGESDTLTNEEKTSETHTGLYDEPTRALIEAADRARQEVEEAERTLREINKKLEELNEALALDAGDDERFVALIHQCFDYQDREYIYTLCPFKKATQRGVNGGGEVSLGQWNSWSGTDNDKFSAMLYDKGQQCWNGPARSVSVVIKCGTENKLVNVSEPARCEYQMEFVTPAACSKLEEVGHDEL